MHGRTPIASEKLAQMVHPRERIYLIMLILASLAVYAFIGLSLFGTLALTKAAEAADPALPKPAIDGTIFIFYLLFLVLFYVLFHGHFTGYLRGNGVRVSERQFPAINQLVNRHAATLSLDPVPPVYIIQAGGTLNAFAIRFFSRSFVVLYSDVVSLAREQGEDALGFVVGHELAHIRRGHLKHQWLKIPGRMVPYLGKAYSRACEYTCDRFSAECQPEGAISGLLVLAAGKSLYRTVDAGQYAEQVDSETGFWVRRAEIASTHPRLPKRVAALMRAGVPLPAPHI